METIALITVAVGLLGTVIGGATLLVSQRLQWRQERMIQDATELRGAVEELIVRAHAMDLASQQAIGLAGAFITLGGTLNRLLRIVTPFDHQALFVPLNTHHDALARAAARVRLTQDHQTVELADEVTDAAANVVQAHSDRLAAPPITEFFRRLFRGRAHDTTQLDRARRRLIAAVDRLVAHTRAELNNGNGNRKMRSQTS